MIYEDYLKRRKEQIHDLVNSKLIHLQDQCSAESIINEALREYEMKVYRTVQELYHQVNLHPELYELERFIPKIKDHKTKHTIDTHFFNLNLLHSTTREMFETDEEVEKEHPSFEDCLAQIPKDKQEHASSILKKYIKETGKYPEYLGSGESCTVFKIGTKVVKFGSKRRYSNIPFCLDIHDEIEYKPNQYMYVTDKIDTTEISEAETEAMYRVLRDEGYVWVDVKPDNIGRQNGRLKILDDVDIYTEQDAMSQHRKQTILEFVSYNTNLALLEIKYQMSKNPQLTIDDIDTFFPNQSTQTKENIDRIKSAYIRQTKPYNFDPNMPYFQTFGKILERKITEQNKISQRPTQKGVTLQWNN